MQPLKQLPPIDIKPSGRDTSVSLSQSAKHLSRILVTESGTVIDSKLSQFQKQPTGRTFKEADKETEFRLWQYPYLQIALYQRFTS